MKLDWVSAADPQRLALWCTYHPSQADRQEFLAHCQQLMELGISFSVGMVGLRQQFDEIEALRDELPAHIYLWINAYQDVKNYYQDEEIERLTAVDPLFPLNLYPHASRNERCRAGESVISVDGEGQVRRCHFISQVIGNIYDPGFPACLQPRPCSAESCNCHIGYVHLNRLNLYELFGPHVLERIPLGWPNSAALPKWHGR